MKEHQEKKFSHETHELLEKRLDIKDKVQSIEKKRK